MRTIVTKMMLTVLMATTFLALKAQNASELKKMYLYNRYESVKKLAEPLAATNAEANYYLGLSLIALGKTPEARAVFSKYPTDIANQTGNVRALFAEKKVADGMAIINTLAKAAKKKDALTFKFLGDALTYSEGVDYKKAIEYYTKSLEIAKDPEAYIGLADAYMHFPDGGGNAESNYEKALEAKGNASLISYKRGNLWYEAREYDEAIKQYNNSIAADPNNPMPYLFFANSYYYKNNFALAKENIEKYLKLSDYSTEDLFQYVNILYLSKDYNGALNKISEMTASGIEKPYIYRVSGTCNLELGKYEEGAKAMEQFFAKSEKSKILLSDYETYAKLLSKVPGKEALAQEYADKAFELDTAATKYDKLRDQAKAMKDAKDYTGSAALWAKLFSKIPADKIKLTDYYNAGFANYAGKNYAEGIRYFSLMTLKDDKEPSGFYYLGMCHAYNSETKNIDGVNAFVKYAGIVGDTNSNKKDQLVKAFSYATEYYYDRNDATNAKLYAAKVLKVSPGDSYATQIIDFFNKGGKVNTKPDAVPNEPTKEKDGKTDTKAGTKTDGKTGTKTDSKTNSKTGTKTTGSGATKKPATKKKK
jgi:tetratricopeptide (TPR) repeat protein